MIACWPSGRRGGNHGCGWHASWRRPGGPLGHPAGCWPAAHRGSLEVALRWLGLGRCRAAAGRWGLPRAGRVGAGPPAAALAAAASSVFLHGGAFLGVYVLAGSGGHQRPGLGRLQPCSRAACCCFTECGFEPLEEDPLGHGFAFDAA
mmetsp:Transcript_87812/g.273152  ORF Transcript_87812/g.273152 Transcript_87812/m.273152 type:complete len:148 (-) Transcript_87812:192-635(-)